MLDEEFLSTLSEEPEMALPLFDKHVRERLKAEGFDASAWRLEYCRCLQGFFDAYSYDFDGLPSEKIHSGNFNSHGPELIDAVTTKVRSLQIKRAQKLKGGNFGSYVLLPAQKIKIRHYIEKLREIVDKAHLTAEKRRELVKRLNAFAAAVELDRTGGEALHSLYVFSKKEAKEAKDEFKDDAKPIFELIERINSVLGKASEHLGLPQREEQKQLPQPAKKIEGPKPKPINEYDLDDDIPF